MFKKLLSVLLAVMMVVSVMAVGVVSTNAATTEGFTPEADKLYFDVAGTGWDMGIKGKISFHIFGGDLENGLQWGTKKALGTAVSGEDGVFSFNPTAKGLTLNEGVQYKIIFGLSKTGTGSIDGGQTYDLLFTTDCLGHIAYCDGTEYENPVDSSKKTLAAFWQDMDATEVGPVLQVSSIGNVVGTCPEAGKTPESIFTDFLTVVDSKTQTTTYVNAKKYVVEPGNKTDQQLIDDIGAGLGLNKDQVQAAFTDNEVETTWSYDASTLPAGTTPHTHTPGEAVQENVVPASCTAEGSYDEVVYCTECGEEISRETKTIDKLAHTPGEAVRENEVPASCKAEGSYDEVVYCTECKEELSRETKTIDKLAHTPGEAVRENEVPATCKAEGSYDEVVYCTACGEEISRETKTIDKLAHTPGEAVRENEVPATCKAEGSYDVVVYCTACGEEISRETKTIDKLAHTPGEAVQENVVPASCTAEGSYDEVVYCSECGEELSREAKTIDMVKHTIKIKPGRAATTEADGWKTHFYCTECGKLFTNFSGTNETTWDQVVIPRIVTGKLGDVDGSGEVDILDVTTIQRVLANAKPADDTINKLGDVDGDGSLDVTDATLLQRWLLGLNQDLKIGEDV